MNTGAGGFTPRTVKEGAMTSRVNQKKKLFTQNNTTASSNNNLSSTQLKVNPYKKYEEPVKMPKLFTTPPETNFTTPKHSKPATKKSMIRYQEAIEEEEMEHMLFSDSIQYNTEKKR